MNKLPNLVAKVLVAASLLFAAPLATADIAVITSPDVREIGLSKDKIADIYLGKIKTYSNGARVQPVDQQANSPIRDRFYKAIVGMSDSEVNRYWSKLKFTGKGKPPKTINGDEAVKSWVASNPGAIGYIDGKYLDKSVKVVLIIK